MLKTLSTYASLSNPNTELIINSSTIHHVKQIFPKILGKTNIDAGCYEL